MKRHKAALWLLLASTLVAISCSPGTNEGQRRSAKAPIIDMHLHAFGFDEYGYPAPPNEVTGNAPTFDSDEAAMRGAFDALRRAGIVRAVASGPREHVDRWREAAPAWILGGAYTGSRDPLPSIEELRQRVDAGSVSVLGELGLQYLGLSADSPELEPYWDLAEALDLPVAVHTGLGDTGTPYDCCPKFRARLGNPLLLEDVLIRHPRLRLYIMHAGYPFLQDVKALLTIYPQVYADLAVINWALPREEFHSYVRALVDAGFADRLMFGSDQMVWPEAIALGIEGIESASFLSGEQKRDIFYNNAARFLKLTAEEIELDHAGAR